MKIVLVEWIDPWSHSGWVDEEDLDAGLNRDLTCSSIGWIVREDFDRVVIASSRIHTDDGWGDLFVIPRSAIIEITELDTANCPSVYEPT